MEAFVTDRDIVFRSLHIQLEAGGQFILLRGKAVQLCVKRQRDFIRCCI
jgi:hypothetical protein